MGILILFFGLFLLIAGANYLVKHSVALAKHFKISSSIFGAVVIAIGTSVPELAVTIDAASYNQSDLIIGNILGSNITNVALVLAVAIAFGKLAAEHVRVSVKNNILLFLSFGFIALLYFKLLFWPVGVAMLVGTVFLIAGVTRKRNVELGDEYRLGRTKLATSVFSLIGSLTCIVVGSRLTVSASEDIALGVGVPIEVIGATMIALGTSLPELVVTVTSIAKRQHSLAVGNIIGSNLFNILMIGGVGAVITNLDVDFPIITALFFVIASVALYLMTTYIKSVRREFGWALLVVYMLFIFGHYVIY